MSEEPETVGGETPEAKPPCDPNDVVCKMEVLRHLQGLEQQLGNDQFQEEFPEAAALRDRITEKVSRQKEVVQEAIDACGDEE